MDLQNQMKQAVALAAVDQIENGMILGLGSGSTAALMIEALAVKIKSGEIKDVVGVTTSFQGEVLASELGIPLKSLSSVSEIDLAIDGADEVDQRIDQGQVKKIGAAAQEPVNGNQHHRQGAEGVNAKDAVIDGRPLDRSV